jgi:hypothetical protein
LTSALHYAASTTCDARVIKYLLKIGFDVNAANDEFNTPVFMAVLANNQKSAAILIQNGADLNCRNNHGFMPFDLIADLDEWIKCDFFDEETKARLRGLHFQHIIPCFAIQMNKTYALPLLPLSLQLQAYTRSHTSNIRKGQCQTDIIRLSY